VVKKSYYIVLAFLLIVTLFTTAAICNMCAAMDQGNSLKEDRNTQVAENENQNDDDQDLQGSSSQNQSVAPTISISIIEGPLYTEDGQLCYYRIKAAVSGSPVPQIHWSIDESNGAYGQDIAQVNLQKGQSYTLVCTAENAAGSKTDSIVLTWTEDGQNVVVDNDNENNNDNPQGEQGEEQQQEDEEEDNQELPEDFNPMEHTNTTTVTLYPVGPETGSVAQDGSVINTQYIYLGMPDGKVDYRGYASFDLTSCPVKLVKSARLFIKNTGCSGSFTEHGEIRVGVIEYGSGALDSRVVNMSSTRVAKFSNDTRDITVQSDKLTELVRESIFAEKNRFQVTLYCQFEGVYPGVLHYLRYSVNAPYIFLEIVFF
jgi:hypothetical protein